VRKKERRDCGSAEFVRTTRESTNAGSAKELDTVRMESIKVTAHNATDLVFANTGRIPGGVQCVPMKRVKDAAYGWCGTRMRTENVYVRITVTRKQKVETPTTPGRELIGTVSVIMERIRRGCALCTKEKCEACRF
jgi:hypothetical protein